jgi:hypothetical protein
VTEGVESGDRFRITYSFETNLMSIVNLVEKRTIMVPITSIFNFEIDTSMTPTQQAQSKR